MRKQFWKQVSKQVCWTDPTNSGERWEAWLKIHIGDTGSSEIKGMNELLVAYLYKTRDMVIGAPEAAMKPYRLSIKIGNGDIRSALKTRLDGCFFETPEEGKKTLKDIISTIDMSSLAH